MSRSLLATKLRVPPVDQYLVRRDRLAGLLERSASRYRVTLVSAPAGYGKTTLLAQWAAVTNSKIVWLSLSEEENDPDRFFRSVLTSWERMQPGILESPLGLLLGGMAPDSQAVLRAFINIAAELSDQTVFVLDDYQAIDEASIHESLAYLIDHLPATIHFILVSRTEPPLPLPRLRARQQLLEIGSRDLAFNAEETAEFLSHRMGIALDNEEIEQLQAQLEGWPAGLQLAALTLVQRRESQRQIAVSGRHRFISDFLSGEVLASQPNDSRRFLLQTGILNQMNAAVCDAVTGRDDSQEMLEDLERQSLFLVPLDDEREWFRYHRLFGDFLRKELLRQCPDDIADLHRRAARWYFDRDLPNLAFDHAVAGDSPDIVSRIFERHVNVKLDSGELTDVARWLDALPSEWYFTHPVLGVARAGLLAYSGEFEACLGCIDTAEQQMMQLDNGDNRWQLALVMALRCFIACIQNDLSQAEHYADRALRDLRDESRSVRASIYHALGDTYRRQGRWEDARACYLKVPNIIDVHGFEVQVAVESVHVFGALADLELQQGRLRAAAGYWREALAGIANPESWGRVELPVTGWVYIRMAEILYEWNDLAKVREHLARGLERAELGGDVRTTLAGYLLAARVNLTDGEVEAASGYLEQARLLVEEAPFPEWLSRFERLQLELWLRQNRLRTAITWADEMVVDEVGEKQPERAIARLAVARILIVKGDLPALERALVLLRQLYAVAEEQGRMAIEVEASALQALAHWRRGEQADAMTVLERTLRLAEPEGYCRLFADLGLAMGGLLQEARSRDVMPDYVAKLLGAFADVEGLDESETTLPEPLTDRELEILQFLAAGLTNPEIADALYISPQTVGKHAGNIYSKLGVHSRTEAAARARELDLLGS